VVEGEGGRQALAGFGGEPVAQLDGGERVEAELAECAGGVEGLRAGEAGLILKMGQVTNMGLVS